MTFKTLLRRMLGDGCYRSVTQSLRLANFIIRPHYEAETEALKDFVRPGMSCFDIGANYGHYSRLLSRLVGGSGAVYAFEPSSVTCAGLRTAQRLLRWNNVHIEQSALAEAGGDLTLTIPIKAHGGLGVALAHLGSAVDRPGLTETVQVTTLDAFIGRRGITACDFIKCDVEGAELRVLMGARETLRRFRPVMLLEINADYLRRNEHGIGDIESFLKDHSYDFYTWDHHMLRRAFGLRNRSNNIVIPKPAKN